VDRPPKIDFAALGRPAFGRHAQHAEPTPHKGKSQAAARRMRMLREARDVLDALPSPGEATHTVVSGRFDMCLLLVAVLDLLPAPCRHLRVATLSFAKRNCTELLGLLETKKVARLTLLCSSFFVAHNRELYEWFAGELRGFPGSRVAHARSHCKVFIIDAGDEHSLTIESSANLRQNSNREQATLFNDAALARWHARWVDELVRHDDE
jgi:hypothetical protein